MNLRPYQEALLEAVGNRKSKRNCIAMATGTGKGHVAGNLMDALGVRKALYLTARKELINQLEKHVTRHVNGDLKVGVEQASRVCDRDCDVVIASIPTLAAREYRRAEKMVEMGFEAVIYDECHHIMSPTSLTILSDFGIIRYDGECKVEKVDNPPVELIGMSATPSRGDGIGLNQVFDDIVYEYGIRKAIQDGYLVPIHPYTIETSTSLDGVAVTGSGSNRDYSVRQLSQVVNDPVRNNTVVSAYGQYAKGLKALVFGVNVEHAVVMCETFNNAGYMARYVEGNMPDHERDDAIRWFMTTPGAILTNCQVLTEGTDIPSVECVIMAAPTKSATRYMQCLGRGTRLADGASDYAESVQLGKDKVLLLDVTDNTTSLGKQAVNICDIYGMPMRKTRIMGENMEEVEKRESQLFLKERFHEIAVSPQYHELFQAPRGCRMKWIRVGEDEYRLPLPTGRSIRVSRNAIDQWLCEIYVANTLTWENLKQHTWNSQQDAFKYVESGVKKTYPESIVLLDKGAPWRKNYPTKAQRGMAKELGISVAKSDTRGSLSDKIQAAKMARTIRSANG